VAGNLIGTTAGVFARLETPAPMLDTLNGAVVAALSVSGPATRLTPAQLPAVAAQCAAQASALSCVLGHRPEEPPQLQLERPRDEQAQGQQAQKEGAA